MANVAITPVKTTEPNVPVEYAFKALAASDVAVIPCGFKDEFTQIHFLGGAAAANVTIKAGNGYAGVNDEAFELGIGKYMALTIDSARFKNITGENKGKILIAVDKACSIAVVEVRI